MRIVRLAFASVSALLVFVNCASALQIRSFTNSSFYQAIPDRPLQSDVEFIEKRYIHGVPQSEATALGPEAVKPLGVLLRDPAKREHWPNIVETLGYIGGSESTGLLIDFESNSVGPMEHTEFKALALVPVALAYIAKTGDEKARKYLERLSSMERSPAHSLRWSYRSYKGQRLVELLAEEGVTGIGIIGDKRARDFLRALRAHALLEPTKNFLLDHIDFTLEPPSIPGLYFLLPNFSRGAVTGEQNPDYLPCGGAGSLASTVIKTHALSVSRHITVTLDEKRVKINFATASQLLQINDLSCTDEVACPVGFSLDTNISTFGTAKDGFDIVDTGPKLIAVSAKPGAFKVVDSITYCAGGGSSLGCTFGGSSIIEASADPDVWAHEFGHVKGLPDVGDCSGWIMNETARNTTAVNLGECICFARP